MADELAVEPDGLRATSVDLADVSARTKAVLASLLQKLDAEGQAWGNDTMGHQFADGANGYLAQVDYIKQALGAKTDLLDQYSETLGDAANTLEQQDQA
jgi:uncharacterized protein YukE